MSSVPCSSMKLGRRLTIEMVNKIPWKRISASGAIWLLCGGYSSIPFPVKSRLRKLALTKRTDFWQIGNGKSGSRRESGTRGQINGMRVSVKVTFLNAPD
jgi:hypothetical protein